jgi:hypothetical protein
MSRSGGVERPRSNRPIAVEARIGRSHIVRRLKRDIMVARNGLDAIQSAP